jgi:chromosome segregation ATPase
MEHNELTTHLMRKKPSLAMPDTFAKADKQRSVAVENFEKWTSSARAKQKAISDEVEIAETAADEAIAALQSQKLEIRSLYDKHAAAWVARNQSVQATHKEKIASLETHCISLAPSKNAVQDAPDIQTLQSLVIELQAQLAQQAGMLKALQKDDDMTDAHVNEANQAIDADQPGGEPLIVPAMSTDEQAARIALRTANADEASQGPVDNISIVSTNALAKGKGKGKPDNGGVY